MFIRLSSPFIFVLLPRISHNNKAAKASEDTRFLWRWLLPIPQAPLRPSGALGPCHRSVALMWIFSQFRNSKSTQFPQVSHVGFTEPPCVFYLWLWKTPSKKHVFGVLPAELLRVAVESFWAKPALCQPWARRCPTTWAVASSCILYMENITRTLPPQTKDLKQSESPCRLKGHIFFYTKRILAGVICYHPWSLKCNEWTSCQTNIHRSFWVSWCTLDVVRSWCLMCMIVGGSLQAWGSSMSSCRLTLGQSRFNVSSLQQWYVCPRKCFKAFRLKKLQRICSDSSHCPTNRSKLWKVVLISIFLFAIECFL